MVWSETDYFYDQHGNLTQREDSRQGSERYHYDVLGQIVGYQDPLGTLHRYRYDACGDRFSTVADNAEGRHTQQDNGTAYQLDKAGQLVSRTDRFSQLALRWNTFGRLAGIKMSTMITLIPTMRWGAGWANGTFNGRPNCLMGCG